MNKALAKILVVSVVATTATLALSEQAAIMSKDSTLWSEPKRSSEASAQLVKDTPVKILKRKGGWYHIQLDNQQEGWVPLLQVRFVIEQEANEQSIAEILRQTAEMPTAAGVTSGVRGMTNQTIESEQLNTVNTLEQLDQYVPTEENLEDFAEQGELETQPDLKTP